MSIQEEEWPDENFLGYVEIHCDTQRALFHKKHVIRLLRMANENLLADRVEKDSREWYNMYRSDCQPYLDKIEHIKSRQHLKLIAKDGVILT